VQAGTSGAYFASFTELAHLPDLWSAMIKATLFGFLAAAISCWYGYSVVGGPKSVGDAVNRAVVLTFIILFFTNFIGTALYFNLVPPKF
jgi:phospholipid/cholesterol/gamma-HCH transport system permease protein